MKFNNAFELAKWIKTNIVCPMEQERKMLEGVRNNYSITL